MTPRFSNLLMIVAAACAASVASAADLIVHVQSAAGAPLEDAVVYAVPATPAASAVGAQYSIDQVNREFVPRVNVVQTGTAVSFPNSDNIRHSVYSFSPPKIFTQKLYAGRHAEAVVFDRSGLVVLGCNIHDLMVSYLLVVDTPYFGHTDHAGAATLPKLPPGDYTLRTWHEPMTQDQQIGEPVHVEATAGTVMHTVRIHPTPP